jgi:hypothetical protein
MRTATELPGAFGSSILVCLIATYQGFTPPIGEESYCMSRHAASDLYLASTSTSLGSMVNTALTTWT